MLFADPVDLLLPSPLHLLAVLLVLAWMACRAPAGSRLRRWRAAFVLAAAWCWIATTPAVAHWLAVSLEHRYPPVAPRDLPPDPVIVVLAGGERFESAAADADALQLNLASHRRTVAAVALWRQAGGTLLFTGTIRGEVRPVAERMAALARRLGVPAACIRVGSTAQDTRHNLLEARALMEPDRPMVLVTSALHMPRAMAVAHALGLRPVAAPSDFRAKPRVTWRAWLPNSGAQPLFSLALHEWLGRAYYELRGWT